MEEEIIVILVPPTVAARGTDTAYTMHVLGGELTNKQKRKILRALLDELKED